ncbi:membrane-associated protein [Andreprevotia lacus DSM 23236]|jgi:membrane-associated protein|uniref:Membrane-associated protein n=1 Tax=Andreprevotia lacus DSM 23236 TaxID=1121001 RepID=A0A1W1XK17_9NEIS|nr:DedA family protein [Andreprevotia lacus]SMC24330.1 membrane-associated protein [Andreprevotia lacus DSM 23236]
MDLMTFVDIFLHLDTHLTDWATQYGTLVYLLLFAVIFCETGLVVMPFLPGDSLLFVAGLVAALGKMDPFAVAGAMGAAAILGDSTNYIIGRTLGEKLFTNPNSKIFRRDYLERTHAFYERHGGKTVTLARFLPIVRTFAPFVAGVGEMPYLRFLAFSVFGTVIWVGGLVTLGYFFGNVEFIRKNLSVLIIAIIGISFIPVVVAAFKERFRKQAA